MYELIQAGERTYYMDCPTKVGIFRVSEKEAVLIDSGSDKDAAKKVKRHLDALGLSLRAIYNTHSHADHIGGNQYLQNLTGCSIYAPGAEKGFTEFPVLEPMMLYGGYPLPGLHNKFLEAKGSLPELLTEEVLPQGLEIISLPGHSCDMVGFRTRDDVIFLADCVSSAETLEKYKIGFMYDIRAQLETLERIQDMEAALFIPAHAPAQRDIRELSQLNANKIRETAERIIDFLEVPTVFEELLRQVFESYGLTMNLQQYVLMGSTLKSCLTYLAAEGRIGYTFEDNRMLWSRGKSGTASQF